ncbi:MAG TPA: ATP-dependent DNA helicase RecG [Chondromyces sp.]|nr:ATP-dependent DNA helicase RecG [Chondromyces sp.]
MTAARRTTASDLQLRPEDPLTRLPGIGPKTGAILAEAGFVTVLDLLLHLPRRYEDRTRLARLDGSLPPGEHVLVRGRVVQARVQRVPRRRMTITRALIDDGRGLLPVVWFNQPWIARRLAEEREYYLYGQLRERRGGALELLNPELEEAGAEPDRVVPVYPRIGGFGGRRLRRLLANCLPAVAGCRDPLPSAVRRRFGLVGLEAALQELHAPDAGSGEDGAAAPVVALNRRGSPAHRRLAFDELLAFSCAVAGRRRRRAAEQAPVIDPESIARVRAAEVLPFPLTRAQRRVLGEIAADLARATPMGRLLQGDVGSGKTAVAALAVLMAVEGGFQAAFMVPTELLAEQHLRTLQRYLTPAGIAPAALTSSSAPSERRAVAAGLADGSLRVVVGTHALFQEALSYRELGLVVIDEQHRFGVLQRGALAAKGRAPHLLVMTATPIPRSLALTVYGDLDLSVIDELPPGRRPVRTVLRPQSARGKVLDFVKQEIAQGGRAFVVYPIIDAGEEVSAAALLEHEAAVRERLAGVAVGVIHGRLPREQREEVTSAFREGRVQVLLTTTIVEVGVDVPEATVMVIESAQRFGLSQLHQLRGRVGRGQRPAWCILLADLGAGEGAGKRLEMMCRSQDGFEIAEADLEIRGPGELAGTRQWGSAGFRFADLGRDHDLIEATRGLASELAAAGALDRLLAKLIRYHPVDRVENGS